MVSLVPSETLPIEYIVHSRVRLRPETDGDGHGQGSNDLVVFEFWRE